MDVILVDAPVEVTQEKGHTGFLRFPSAAIALSLMARNIQPSLSLVDREVEFCVPKILLGVVIIYLFLRGKIPVRVTTPRFERSNVKRFRGYQLNHRGDHLSRVVL